MRRRRPKGGDLPAHNLPAEMSNDTERTELGQDPAELGPDLRHELGPGMVEIEPRGKYAAGRERGARETRPSELAA